MKAKWAIALGNLLEHYSTALYALLAPFLAPIFFPFASPLTGLIFTYGLIPLSMVTRPLGALFFGWIGDRIGRKESLFISLLGTAITTAALGFLPTYQEVGIVAPILLGSLKAVQKFFSAGEVSGGAILLLENTPKEKRSLYSSFYDATTLLGILLASFLTAFFASTGTIAQSWRILFWLGSLVGGFAFFLRKKFFQQLKQPLFKESSFSLFSLLKSSSFFAILFAAGFSQVTFAFSFTFLNGYLPCVSSFSAASLLKINTYLLVCDLFLLPIFGFLSMKFGKEKILLFGLLGTLVCSFPLFSLLSFESLWIVGIVRFFLLFFGTAFAAPFYAWALEKADPKAKCTMISLGSALGAQLIGAPSCAISLWLYQQTGWAIAPSFYLWIVAGMTLLLIRSSFSFKAERRSMEEGA